MRFFWFAIFLFISATGSAKHLPLPNPSNLDSNWWGFFHEDSDAFPLHVEEFLKWIEELEAHLGYEIRRDLNGTLRRIRINLAALPDASREKLPAMPIAERVRKEYTVDQLLEAFSELESVRSLLEEEQDEVIAIGRAIDRGRKQLDILSVSYQKLEEKDGNRLAKGLEIIAQKIGLELSTHRLRIQEGAVDQILSIFKNRKEIVASALDTPVADPVFDARLSNLMETAKAKIESAENQILAIETSIFGLFSDASSAQSNQALLRQGLLKARVEYASAELDLTRLFLKKYLNTSYSNLKNVNSINSVIDLDEIDSQLDEYLVHISEWRFATRREYARASEGYGRSPDRKEEGSDTDVYRSRLIRAQETTSAITALEVRLAEIQFLGEVARDVRIAKSGKFGRFLSQGYEFFHFIWKKVSGIADAPLFRVGRVPVTLLGVFYAFAIVILGFWISNFTQRTILGMGEGQRRSSAANFYVIGRLAHYAILLMSLVIALASLGLDFSNLALVAGALSVGIGFGLQTIVSNFFSGLIILFEGNLKVGDFLELESGSRGRITSINVRSTIIRTNDGIEVVIPNAEIIGNRVVNWTMSDVYRRIHVPFSVPYGSDKDLVVRATLEAAGRVEATISDHKRYNDPKVNLTGFGDSALEFELVVWVDRGASKRYRGTVASYLWEIDNSFKKYKIEIPFPQRDLNVKEVPKR